jgi:hypothetical protein
MFITVTECQEYSVAEACRVAALPAAAYWAASGQCKAALAAKGALDRGAVLPDGQAPDGQAQDGDKVCAG